MDLKEFYWKDCRKREIATPGLMVHPVKLLMLDLPRKRYRHAHNGYYKDPAHSRNVPLIHMSAMRTMKYPSLTLETWSFLPPFLLRHPSGRTDNPACTNWERVTSLKRERGWGLHKLTSSCTCWSHKTVAILCLATALFFGVSDG